MAHYLTIDQGNSEAKIALWDDTRLLEFLMEPALTPRKVSDFVGSRKLSGAIYCSVTREDVDILRHLRHLCPKALRLTPATPLPVRNAYSTPSTLGSDRVAAAVGAWGDYPGKDILVVDAGTAVTYDHVSADGHFIGGNIAPGIGLRLKALNAFTARLPLINGRGETMLWGNSTETAMRSGAVNGVIAEISYYRSRLSGDAIVVLSGGWGRELAPRLDFETDYQECLVTRGREERLKYNETI